MEDPAATAQQSSRPNVFQTLSQERRLPKMIAGDQLRGDQKLHNDVIDVLEKIGIGWSPLMCLRRLVLVGLHSMYQA